MKEALIKHAKMRENQIKKMENSRLNFLRILYQNEFKNNGGRQGVDEEISEIKKEMHQIYFERSRRLVDKIRGLEIEDHVYDIHKLQIQRKFEKPHCLAFFSGLSFSIYLSRNCLIDK